MRIKDIEQKRCPEQEESERQDWKVRKQHGTGLVIPANVKSRGNKGS